MASLIQTRNANAAETEIARIEVVQPIENA